MDPNRKGEIAYGLLKLKLRKDKVILDPDVIQRDIPNLAVAVNATPEEMKEFMKTMAQELVDEAFPA